MKGVILAGGLGTRLYPLTKATNKHLLPVYNKPMVFYPVEFLISCGITDICIVTGGPHAGHFLPTLRNGEDFGLSGLNYAYQDGEGGIADALLCAESFVGDDPCVVILGDNVFIDDQLPDKVKAYGKWPYGAMLFLKDVPDPERYGVPVFHGGKLMKIEEKPKNPASDFAITGLYLYDNTVFEKIKSLSPSDRDELEVTDLNNMYIDEERIRTEVVKGDWLDCGTPEALVEIGQIIYEKSRS